MHWQGHLLLKSTPKNPNQRIADAGGEDDHQPHSEHHEYSTSSSDGDKQTQPDRIPSTTPGAEPPRDARDSGSARSLIFQRT